MGVICACSDGVFLRHQRHFKAMRMPPFFFKNLSTEEQLHALRNWPLGSHE